MPRERKIVTEVEETSEEIVTPVETSKVETNRKLRPIVITIDPDTEVEVASNFAGTLIYISSKTSEEFVWSKLGDINMMPYSELETMRNSQRKFFENNWVKLVGENAQPALQKLRVENYYTNFVDLEKIEDYASLSEEEIVEKVSPMKREIKDVIAVHIKTMVEEGKLDKLKIIKAFEKAIGYKLLEE